MDTLVTLVSSFNALISCCCLVHGGHQIAKLSMSNGFCDDSTVNVWFVVTSVISTVRQEGVLLVGFAAGGSSLTGSFSAVPDKVAAHPARMTKKTESKATLCMFFRTV